MIEVNLIDYTQNAVEKLIYTKSTRLEQGFDTRTKIENMSEEEKSSELEYMAKTIPSSWEFVNYTFEIKNVTRAFTHQFVRTRTGSYAQQTMRMLNRQDFTYRIPKEIEENQEAKFFYKGCMDMINQTYKSLIKCGIKEEDARGVLPTNIHTNIIAQFNLRTLADMAKSRSGLRTQDEYREVLCKMLDAVCDVHPWASLFFCSLKSSDIKELETHIDELRLDPKRKYDMLKILDRLRKS